jgi:hypothetical protein
MNAEEEAAWIGVAAEEESEAAGQVAGTAGDRLTRKRKRARDYTGDNQH